MDPDMVRQQEEAEREALALLLRKPSEAERKITATVSLPGGNADGQALAREMGAAPHYRDSRSEVPHSSGGLAAPASLEGPKPMPQPIPRKRGSAFAWLGRFISFGLAGAVLGGSIGIVAEIYLQLLGDQAKLAVFGAAGFLAALSALASLFKGNSKG